MIMANDPYSRCCGIDIIRPGVSILTILRIPHRGVSLTSVDTTPEEWRAR